MTQTFTDARYMSAREKATVLRQWRLMLRRDLADQATWSRSRALYQHLTLHCGHIAHYDQGGFWHAQLGDAVSRARFLEETVDYMRRATYPAASDYRDIHDAMIAEAEQHRDRIIRRCLSGRIAELRQQRDSVDAELARLTQLEEVTA